MDHRPLGATGLEVSAVCLGTMTWGEQNSEAEAHAQIDLALDRGVNFLDAAEMYPVPPRAETQGRTEACIGSWLRARGGRDRMILATKVVGDGRGMGHIRDGNPRLDGRNIVAALDASLKRLATDYVDLYQVHWPSRRTNTFGQLGYRHDPDDRPVPIEETLEALARQVEAGKVRHVGVSNETPWGLARYLSLAERGLPRVASIQNCHNLVNRVFEVGLAEMAIRERCGLLAYSPLAGGHLTGKYLGGARPPGARMTLFTRFTRYDGARGQRAIADYVALALRHGLDPAQMAIAFLLGQPFVTSVIVGATTLDQLESDIASQSLLLPEEIVRAIDAIHADNPNPCP